MNHHDLNQSSNVNRLTLLYRDAKFALINAISYTVGFTVYFLLDVGERVSESVPFGEGISKTLFKYIYRVKQGLHRLVESKTLRGLFFIITFIPVAILLLITLFIMLGISSVTITILAMLAFGTFLVISIFAIPALLVASIALGSVYLAVSVVPRFSRPRESSHDQAFASMVLGQERGTKDGHNTASNE